MTRKSGTVQLCGRFAVELEGRRVERDLPGKQGRLLFACLAMNRGKAIDRESLMEVLWPLERPDGADTTLRGLIFRLRKVLGGDMIEGKGELTMSLPAGTAIDVETARGAIHTAESAAALGHWKQAWLPSRVALSVAEAQFMIGHEGTWVEDLRHELDGVRLRALDCIAETGLALGGPELAGTERAANSLIRLDPFRESGYRHLMRARARSDDVAGALRAYERIRSLLRDELGIAPGRGLQDLHGKLVRRQ